MTYSSLNLQHTLQFAKFFCTYFLAWCYKNPWNLGGFLAIEEDMAEWRDHVHTPSEGSSWDLSLALFNLRAGSFHLQDPGPRAGLCPSVLAEEGLSAGLKKA